MSACALKSGADAIIIDMHCEATSEKQAMGYFVDGRASLVVGTHTHAPTADDRILPDGTAFISDVGMTGDYDSIIGMNKDEPLNRFLRKLPGAKFEAVDWPRDVVRACRRDRRYDRPCTQGRRRAARRHSARDAAEFLGLTGQTDLPHLSGVALSVRRKLQRSQRHAVTASR